MHKRTTPHLATKASGTDSRRTQATIQMDHSTSRSPMSQRWNCWNFLHAGSGLKSDAESYAGGVGNSHRAGHPDSVENPLSVFPTSNRFQLRSHSRRVLLFDSSFIL